MRRKLIQNYVFIILISIGITAAAFFAKGYSYLVKENERNLISRAGVLADSFCREEIKTVPDMEEYLKVQSEKFNVRLTLIDQKGNVRADSDSYADIMKNHKNRPEIRYALEKGKGADHRYSETMGVEYYYAAVEVSTDSFQGVLRICEPAHEFQRLLISL